ncbi:MAG TPA: biopolymer transporter ExbD [Gammaproteobacteria bacterium]|jgi:biopolymer transport protein ExbD|nr:biopolymer transporter ExbD [Gammaproteobacteria bacterium]HIK72493.1 biopolymer transporter ExbD [Gammaproteobacteria bacterium]
MRRSPISSAVAEEEDINLTPMLDVVFILLIFFIVTANFIKEPGLEVNRPDAETSSIQENAAILIAIGPTNDIWIDGRRIDVRQVKANITKLLADNPKGTVVIQADEKATADSIIAVMDQSREAGVYAISLASEPKF